MYYVGYYDQPEDVMERIDISQILLDEIKVSNIDNYLK